MEDILQMLDDLSAAFRNVMATHPAMPDADRAARLALINKARALCDAELGRADVDGPWEMSGQPSPDAAIALLREAIDEAKDVLAGLQIAIRENELLDLLKTGRDLIEEALTTHIYDELNGDEIPEDCGYTAHVAAVDRLLPGIATADPDARLIASINEAKPGKVWCFVAGAHPSCKSSDWLLSVAVLGERGYEFARPLESFPDFNACSERAEALNKRLPYADTTCMAIIDDTMNRSRRPRYSDDAVEGLIEAATKAVEAAFGTEADGLQEALDAIQPSH